MRPDDLLRPSLNNLPGIVAGYSTRIGGLSRGDYASLNLGLSTGDDAEAVALNRRRFFAAFDVDPDHVASAEQVHGDRVARVLGPGVRSGVDGLVTDRPGIPLTIAAADCAAVLMADPHARVIGACHSGWRGTVARIVRNTVHEMVLLGADPIRLHAFIGPCISPEKFEVGEEVAARFDEQYVRRRPEWPRPHVDLKSALSDQLRQCGLPAHAIEVSPYCTATDLDRFFSYRAEGGSTGRMIGLIMLT